jgi:N-acetylmuramic acid 6-phosphate etherase
MEHRLPETEGRHPATARLSDMGAREILELMNAEERVAVTAAAAGIPQLAELVEDTVQRVRSGGRVHYFGAGTSGRLGVLDAAELVPTFGTDPALVQAHIAGGADAVLTAVEDSEDSEEDGAATARSAVRPGDVAIGITVSGGTPYVAGALRAACDAGAATALLTSNPGSPLASLADHVIVMETGREVLTGSTRLKAGTATKITLNGFSTALMIGLGRTYSNLMVAVVATNHKLRDRTLRILAEVTGEPEAANAALLASAGGDLRIAIVSSVSGAPVDRAAAALEESAGSIPVAIELARARAAR